MFAGKHGDIDAALTGAAQKANLTANDKIELELRFRPYTGESNRGVGNESALFRVRNKLEKLAVDSPSEWYKEEDVEDTVELYQGGYRKIQSDGKEVVYQKKISEEGWKIKLDDQYPAVFSVSIESDLGGLNKSLATADSRRTRKRSSFLRYKEGQKILRIDLTIVENESKGKIVFSYEVEMEILAEFKIFGTNPIYDEVKEIVQEVSKMIIMYVNDTPFFYDVPTWTKMLSEMNLLFTSGASAATHSVKDWVNKPKSLSWKDLTVSENRGLVPANPQNDALYAVTIKTDGRRVLLYFHQSGIYLCMPFTNLFSRIYEESVNELNGTIMDCELIEEGNLIDQTNYHIYIFDCLFAKGIDYREKNLRSRLGAARAVVEIFRRAESQRIVQRINPLILTVKSFYSFTDRNTFYNANRMAHLSNLGPDKTPLFKEDGLVYTDMGVYYPRGNRKCPCREVKVRCEECINFNPSRNLKYKLPSNVTIDFLVETDVSSNLSLNTRDYREEYKGTRTAPFVGTKRFPADPRNFRNYIVVDKALGTVETLRDGQIVEFMWSRDEQTWIPLRIRKDRADPNSTHVANENWEIIQDPITFGFLLGKVHGVNILKLQRMYHNQVKASTLDYWANEITTRLQRMGINRNPILFDIGSGKGGDVLKWQASEFEVFALEPDEVELKELSRRAQQAKISDRVYPVRMQIQQTERIRDLVQKGIIKTADMVTSFHSMTLIYKDVESVNKFIESVKAVINKNGIFACMAMDGKAIEKLMGENKQITIEGITLQKVSRNQIIVQMTGTRDDRLAGQVEYLVDFDDLITRMEAAGFQLIKDVHLDSQIVLNDTELLWSQLTRMIQMQYFGFKTPPRPSKRLEGLLDIMKSIRAEEDSKNIQSVKVNEFALIPKGVYGIPFSSGQKFWTLGVMAGGSCFFHAILWCINQEYRDKDANFRFELVVRLRVDLARNFTREIYNSIDSGHLKDFGTSQSIYSYESIRDGLSNYTHWFGLEFLSYIQEKLHINIHILWFEKGKLKFYNTQASHNKERNNLLLYWKDRNHFQPVGRSNRGNNMASFVFSSSDLIFNGFW